MFTFRRLLILSVILFFGWISWTIPARASVPLNDQLEATETCEAFQSFRRRTNPGNIQLTPGQIYPVTAKNKDDATHYYLRIDDAEPTARWVSTSCGNLLGTPPVGDITSSNPANILAISWQPSFCETRQDKDECESQTEDRFDATNFTLHGLWPKEMYCNVDSRTKDLDNNGNWSQLPPITLSSGLFNDLKTKMPGVASDLHLHEWYKHGTCYSETAEEYYQESLDLLDQVNNSSVQDLFESNIGQVITSNTIRDEFDEAFDNNAGDKVTVSCKNDNTPTNRRMIVELKLNLKGDVEDGTLISDLFENGRRVGSGCSNGEVDPVGFD